MKYFYLASNKINLDFGQEEGHFYFDERYSLAFLINLKRNQVKSLLNFTFSNMDNLGFIYLDENLIEIIETNAFFKLKKLQFIFT